jgi:pheromone shutdown-related protein TraB
MDNEKNIYKIELENKEVILIGSAHVSRKSAEDVEDIVNKENPDAIGVELDINRYKIITEERNRPELTIETFFEMLFDGRLPEFLLTTVLAIPQNRLAEKFNIKPGAEMIKGINLAKEKEKKLLLLDRDVSVTLSRLMNSIPLWITPFMGFSAIFSLIAIEFLKEEDIEKLRSGQNLEQAIEQLSKTFPKLKQVMIDERDAFIAKKIIESESEKIVAVLGAGHIKGVTRYLREGFEGVDFDEINKQEEFNPLKNIF